MKSRTILKLVVVLGALSLGLPFTQENSRADNPPSSSGSLIDLLELQLEGIPPAFSLVALEKDLNRVAQSMYRGKASVIRKAADLAAAIPAPSSDSTAGASDALLRLFVMNAI